ncbi:MAG: hypothetical protein SW833_22370 [Cyanobacteriota bacterium]|nr:hypothetical protein [Cyanobacteriota bacterium]
MKNRLDRLTSPFSSDVRVLLTWGRGILPDLLRSRISRFKVNDSWLS